MKSKTYMGWQFDVKADLSAEVQRAIDFYIHKHGNPPAIIEHSDKIESPKLPVEFKGIRIPNNILLLGE